MLRIVLVVDDEPSFLDQFVGTHDNWFAKAKLEVRPLDSPAKARRFLRTHGNDVEIALIDILLTKKKPQQAVGLLKYLKTTMPVIKRVAMTVHAGKDDVGKLSGLIDGYFNKDWTLQRIRKEIRRVLEEPPDPATHGRIAKAVRLWLAQNPQAKGRRIPTLGPQARTLEEIAAEIEKGTRFGVRQERLIYQLAWNLFAGKSQAKKTTEEPESH